MPIDRPSGNVLSIRTVCHKLHPEHCDKFASVDLYARLRRLQAARMQGEDG